MTRSMEEARYQVIESLDREDLNVLVYAGHHVTSGRSKIVTCGGDDNGEDFLRLCGAIVASVANAEDEEISDVIATVTRAAAESSVDSHNEL